MGFFRPAAGADEADDASGDASGAFDSEDPGAVGAPAGAGGGAAASGAEAGAGEAPDPGT